MHLKASTGFVLPLVLGFLLVAAVFGANALADATLDRALATMRLYHQRAFEAAERGIGHVLEQMQAGTEPVPGPTRLPPQQSPVDSTEVTVTSLATGLLPAGYSAGRFIEQLEEVRSTGRSARSAKVVEVQGVRRLQPQAVP
jgi:Tfp pilus assembly protein PilX